jgi:hypothetical protein
MSDTPEYETTSDESPTIPLSDPSTTQPETPAWQESVPPHMTAPPTTPQPALVAAIVAGALLITALTFGAGWTARGMADRIHGPSMRGIAFAPGQGRVVQGAPNECPGCQDPRGLQSQEPGMRGARPGQGAQGEMGGRGGMRGQRQMPSQIPTQDVPGAAW